MDRSRSQKFKGRNRSPHVQIKYDPKLHAVEKCNTLPFMRVGVLADLSGSLKTPTLNLQERQMNVIDIGNFDTRMRYLKPRVAFTVPNRLRDGTDLTIDITFESMDDFSPTAVVRKVACLNKLLTARSQLEKFSITKLDSTALKPLAAINSIIQKIDRKLSQQLNLIMHHPEFQQLEGAWRGLQYLIENTETNEMLKVHFMSVSKKELGKTIYQYRRAWYQSPLFKIIYGYGNGTLSGEPYGCFIGDYEFENSPRDIEILRGMAQIAASAHVPFVSGASPSIFQMESWQETAIPRDLTKVFMTSDYAGWHSLRESDDSRYLGLTFPRFLARPPYGNDTTLVKEFNFQEDIKDGDPSCYTWCNSAYAFGANIAHDSRPNRP